VQILENKSKELEDEEVELTKKINETVGKQKKVAQETKELKDQLEQH